MESLQSALAAIQKKLATPELVAAAQDIATQEAALKEELAKDRELRKKRVKKDRKKGNRRFDRAMTKLLMKNDYDPKDSEEF